jgi:hypothetical protein
MDIVVADPSSAFEAANAHGEGTASELKSLGVPEEANHFVQAFW